MDILLLILALVLSLVGLAGCIVPVLPGTAFSYLGLLAGALTSYSAISRSTLWIWLVVSIVVIAADFVFPAMMTKRFGGSRYGSIGATVGIFVGLLAGHAGVILGPFLGAVVGELLHDKTDTQRALRVGFGSFMAFIAGTGLKLVTSIWMLTILMGDLWPVVRGFFSSLFA